MEQQKQQQKQTNMKIKNMKIIMDDGMMEGYKEDKWYHYVIWSVSVMSFFVLAYILIGLFPQK